MSKFLRGLGFLCAQVCLVGQSRAVSTIRWSREIAVPAEMQAQGGLSHAKFSSNGASVYLVGQGSGSIFSVPMPSADGPILVASPAAMTPRADPILSFDFVNGGFAVSDKTGVSYTALDYKIESSSDHARSCFQGLSISPDQLRIARIGETHARRSVVIFGQSGFAKEVSDVNSPSLPSAIIFLSNNVFLTSDNGFFCAYQVDQDDNAKKLPPSLRSTTAHSLAVCPKEALERWITIAAGCSDGKVRFILFNTSSNKLELGGILALTKVSRRSPPKRPFVGFSADGNLLVLQEVAQPGAAPRIVVAEIEVEFGVVINPRRELENLRELLPAPAAAAADCRVPAESQVDGTAVPAHEAAQRLSSMSDEAMPDEAMSDAARWE